MNDYYLDMIPIRLYQLRKQKKISANDMSLKLGHNRNYISDIENGKAYPSMVGLINICDFLGITVSDFFDDRIENPALIRETITYLRQLSDTQLQHISALAQDLSEENHKA